MKSWQLTSIMANINPHLFHHLQMVPFVPSTTTSTSTLLAALSSCQVDANTYELLHQCSSPQLCTQIVCSVGRFSAVQHIETVVESLCTRIGWNAKYLVAVCSLVWLFPAVHIFSVWCSMQVLSLPWLFPTVHRFSVWVQYALPRLALARASVVARGKSNNFAASCLTALTLHPQ